MRRSGRDVGLWIAAVSVGLLLLFLSLDGEARAPYTEALAAIEAGKVKTARIDEDELRLELADVKRPLVVARIPNMDERTLLDAMARKGVVIEAQPRGSLAWLWYAIPGAALLASILLGRGRAQAGAASFTRSKARVVDAGSRSTAKFLDVAGVDDAKAELAEVVRFLAEPERFRKIGARIPRGILLVGPPGTGKTLLARAVAGEAGVAFFSLSGSEFVELFVGVGASRVRDLFEQAKGRAPSIVFIDELDAIGKTRSGAQGFVANEEREQALNQLLVEMDGFDASSGVVVLAATNRPEILDRALLRAGRFDRQVLVDGPDVQGRTAILEVHARKVVLDRDVDLPVVAQRTAGMVGADLANLVNEAALAAVRRDAVAVEARDFEEAIDRLRLGLRKQGRILSAAERRLVAVHESGHAVVALSSAHADPVDRVTIVPRSVGALGATLQLPETDRYLLTRRELEDRLAVLFGGRAAEELVLGEESTGAADDLVHATETAHAMVTKLGMSKALGPMSLGGLPPDGTSQLLGEECRDRIDTEIGVLLTAAHHRARAILLARRPLVDAVCAELLAKETLGRADLARLVRAELPRVEPGPCNAEAS